jgi:hypothetical protein
MNQPETINTIETRYKNNDFCAECPQLGSCTIIFAMMKLDIWNADNPAVEERDGDEETMLTRKQQNAILIRPHAGELLVDLVGVQTDCVASMQAGGESMQETAVSVISGSRVASLAQRERRA